MKSSGLDVLEIAVLLTAVLLVIVLLSVTSCSPVPSTCEYRYMQCEKSSEILAVSQTDLIESLTECSENYGLCLHDQSSDCSRCAASFAYDPCRDRCQESDR